MSELFYHADEKYAVSEQRASDQEWERIIKEKLPQLVEKEIRESITLKLGLEEESSRHLPWTSMAFLYGVTR